MSKENTDKKMFERYEFRNIHMEEISQAAEIEKICFPPNEACTYKHMEERIKKAKELFLVAVDRDTGKIVGFLNGLATNREHLTDDFFEDADVHEAEGRNIMLLGLDVLPEYRCQGLARELMRQYLEREKQKGRKRVVLTCLPDKIRMYEKFGFEDHGIGESVWGGEAWYEMSSILNDIDDLECMLICNCEGTEQLRSEKKRSEIFMDLMQEAILMGFSGAAVMDTKELVFVPEYRTFCEENLCGCYNLNPACPPASGTVEEMKQRALSYEKTLVLQTTQEDLHDPAEYKKEKLLHNKMTEELAEKMRAEGKTDILIMSAGPYKKNSCMSAYCVDAQKMADAAGMLCWTDDGNIRYFSQILFHE